jgi:cytochrome P450
MHRKFGPIVRTRPDAVHIDDPAFIDEIYTQSSKRRREKFHTLVNLLLSPGSISGTADHDLHRRRRAVLNRYFSRQSVRQLEPAINDTLATLLERLKGWAKEGTPVHMNTVFRAAAKDIIQQYAFGGGQSCLEMEDCNAPFFDVLEPHPVTHLGTYMPWLARIMRSIPPALMTILAPRIGVFTQFLQVL